jgi:hypothetical protein
MTLLLALLLSVSQAATSKPPMFTVEHWFDAARNMKLLSEELLSPRGSEVYLVGKFATHIVMKPAWVNGVLSQVGMFYFRGATINMALVECYTDYAYAMKMETLFRAVPEYCLERTFKLQCTVSLKPWQVDVFESCTVIDSWKN